MPIVENEVIINAPVQEIYDYVSKPKQSAADLAQFT